MEQEFIAISVDEFSEIIVDGSEPIEPGRAVHPPISAEKKEFLHAIDQAQRHYTGSSLTWATSSMFCSRSVIAESRSP